MASKMPALAWITTDWTKVTDDVLVVPVFKVDSSAGAKKASKKTTATPLQVVWTDTLTAIDKAMGGELKAVIQDDNYSGEKSTVLKVRAPKGSSLKSKAVVLVGFGLASAVRIDLVDKAFVKVIETLAKHKGTQSVAFLWESLLEGVAERLLQRQLILSVADAAMLATYASLEAKEQSAKLEKISLLLAKKASSEQQADLKLGLAMANARQMVKDMVNMPSNIKRTDTFVQYAKQVGKLPNVSVSIQSDSKWIAKTMPCFYEVAKGSLASDPPKWIVVKYVPAAPKGAAGKTKKAPVGKHLALVGKSLIFDTGGYQVKPGDSMVSMKGDMTGGACVLATIQAIATVAPNIAVTAYMAVTPNLIDSNAMIPDAIVDTTCGKKVEIRHTDAEGRLTLIDAVTMAAKDKPDAMVTIATLTGAAAVAVGQRIALMSNDTALRDKVEHAARFLGEPVQPLDIGDEDYESIKSKLDGADIRNTSKTKGRGAQTAGAFVMSGAPEGLPVAHLDIAGCDIFSDETASGIGAKTLIEYVLSEANAR